MDVLPWLMVFLLLLTYERTHIEAQSTKVRMCYMLGESMEKTGFTVDTLNASYCTHIIYAFVSINNAGNELNLAAFDEKSVEQINKLTNYKEKNPSIRLLISVKGNFAKVTNDTKKLFTDNAFKFLKDNNFDGFDLFTDIINSKSWKELKTLTQMLADAIGGLKFEKKPLLTVPIWGTPRFVLRATDTASITRYVDYFLLMTYTLWGRWYNKLAHHAPLDIRKEDSGDREMSRNSIKKIVNWWIARKVRRSQLILGLAFFGVSALLKSADRNKISDPYSLKVGAKGSKSQIQGILYYSEICEKVSNKEWTENYIETNEGAIAYKDLQWVSYDNSKSIYKKTEYALNTGLGGVFIYTVGKDRLDTTCEGKAFPLLSKVNEAFDDYIKNCGNFTCPKEWKDGYLNNQHPDPKDCGFFYQCIAPGTNPKSFKRMPCPASLHYRTDTARCEYQEDANCVTCG